MQIETLKCELSKQSKEKKWLCCEFIVVVVKTPHEHSKSHRSKRPLCVYACFEGASDYVCLCSSNLPTTTTKITKRNNQNSFGIRKIKTKNDRVVEAHTHTHTHQTKPNQKKMFVMIKRKKRQSALKCKCWRTSICPPHHTIKQIYLQILAKSRSTRSTQPVGYISI